MTGADAASAVPMEVLVEEHEVLPVGIPGEAIVGAVAGATPRAVGQEDPGESCTQLPRYFLKVQHASRSDGAFDSEVRAIEMVEPFDGLEQQVVEREPDRASPVGVAPEQSGARLARV